MAAKESGTNTALQSSVAFLQIQKNANLKRSTSMNEDVFRIFRQTGRRIALIKQQVERERCTYLKDSYTEKNQLYKELAGIFYSKKGGKNQQGVDVLSATPHCHGVHSRVGKTAEKTSEGHSGHCSSLKSVKELPSINVNVLKRCECCRRRAFQKVEDDDDDENDVFDEEAFQCAESQPPDENSNEKSKTKAVRKISRASKSSSESVKSKKGHSPGKHKTKMVQFSRYDDIRMPAATQRVQAGIRALKKQNVRPDIDQSKQASRTVRFDANNSAKSSSRELKTASETPGLSTTTRPTLRSRASMKLESQNNKNEKVHLDGSAWADHLQNVQEKKTNSNRAISGLSKAYCAFKKLLNKMEEEYQAEQAQDEELRCESRGELPVGSRPASHMSRRDSRWLPLRRSSDTLSIRLNSWTMGSVEPVTMGSFSENGEEEQEENKETLGLDTGEGESDRDSLHEVYILEQNSLPDILNHKKYSS